MGSRFNLPYAEFYFYLAFRGFSASYPEEILTDVNVESKNFLKGK